MVRDAVAVRDDHLQRINQAEPQIGVSLRLASMSAGERLKGDFGLRNKEAQPSTKVAEDFKLPRRILERT